MRMDFTRSLLWTSCLTASALMSPLPAMAADTILSGGSTLAEPIYNELFTVDSGVTFEYCGVGSGNGQTAALTNSITTLMETTLKTGDSPICTSLTAANKPVVFGASDATLNSTQLSGYSRSSTDGPIIQVPTLGTPITIPVAESKVTSNSTITLNDDDLCGVFSGQITNWSQTSVASTVITGPIDVEYRLDGSGTTFLLTQHLHAVCSSVAKHPTSIFTGATTSFASLFPSGVPKTFFGATGSQGVQTALVANIASTTSTLIGYLSPDYTAITTTPPTHKSTLFVAELVNATSLKAVSPTTTQTANALATGNSTIPATLAAASSQSNWVPLIPNPSTGYPIVGYTTIDTVTCYATQTGNPTNAGADIKGFLSGIFTNPTYGADITGYGFVNLPSALATAANAVFVTNAKYVANGTTVGPWGLDINDTTACHGKTGRSTTN